MSNLPPLSGEAGELEGLEKLATPGPWRKRTTGNMGNLIEADSGKRAYPGDDGFRAVGTYQSCCTDRPAVDENANAEANGALIVALRNTALPIIRRQAEEIAWLNAECTASMTTVAEERHRAEAAESEVLRLTAEQAPLEQAYADIARIVGYSGTEGEPLVVAVHNRISSARADGFAECRSSIQKFLREDADWRRREANGGSPDADQLRTSAIVILNALAFVNGLQPMEKK